ncbi:hypothetical protein [Aquisediminimonas sediminicola]|uniref:hypothetical protein n=1 Tax=Alteraquisediminimonas sediminicola TaxID=2676787 RepID=UPI001C8D1EF3|nr:hypothetical protein [Aquisediminimonas sediminicola]
MRAHCRILLLTSLCMLIAPAQAATPENHDADLSTLNLALKRTPLDPRLNFLAGLSYEISSVPGTERREMARTGYLMALKSDAAFWPAHVQLALMALEDRDAQAAQRHFIEAALIKPDEPVIFYGLARSAYISGDLALAATAYAGAVKLRTPASEDDFITGAAILAKAGDRGQAEHYARQLAMTHNGSVPMVTSAFRPAADHQEPAASEPVPAEPEIASKAGMVDIIILRKDEMETSMSGINLLDALTLQLGGSLINARWASSRDQATGMLSSNKLDITHELTASIPSVTYSLNIANAQDGWSTVQTQQALLIYDGETSKVTLGDSLTYATDGQLNSAMATKDVGLMLQVKPTFAPDHTVRLDVSASLEDFLGGSSVGSFRQSVQTAKTTTDVVALMKFGETILLSSGMQGVNERASSRTPVVSAIPMVGKLFKSQTKTKTKTSIIIMLTLRPQGSEKLPHVDDRERANFENMKEELLEQLDSKDRSAHFERFIPDRRTISYQLENPARMHDTAYLARAGVILHTHPE